ncbi:DegT/DnrJ/EryC1/StrS family aminotransferase [Desulfotalea psychrophila]|uniref:Probable pleiotropic regulatory protein n=1 Tax=Desulfotalea psychrophila (strain LSv54 / DSM 12343) TaxID=177439 RepID=Q6AL55_DESPS|nr:DegT/DnrJ/EryC1/StrS family aminotransferase [Desulfotalea psychrophila]CAG36920.1 probable pleiotropic regulatory protein [Desulfotalea psychrophila LSv54]
MKVPLLDLRAQLATIEDEMVEAVVNVVRSTRYIQGPEVEGLEQEIAEYSGVARGVGVSSGTDALLVSLMSLGIGQGDYVLTTPYSFFATMGVILRVGAKPVFADIDLESYNIDPEKMAEVLAADVDHKIKAIIPVHLYGQCADMKAINKLAEQYNIPVVEDAAQAIGAEYPLVHADGSVEVKKAGALGTCGCFSFFPSKNLGGIGDGGMVVTTDEKFADHLALMRNHGMNPKYYHPSVGGNFRLDPIQATALRVKLPHLNSWHDGRRENADSYAEMFARTSLLDEAKVVLPKRVYQEFEGEIAGRFHIYNQFILRVEKRDELRDFLLAEGVGCEVYYPVPLHKQECLGAYSHGLSYPEAEKAADTTIALPIYAELTAPMQQYVVDKIAEFYSKDC